MIHMLTILPIFFTDLQLTFTIFLNFFLSDSSTLLFDWDDVQAKLCMARSLHF
jgi:hypothetical protein